jgi:hypothetical protein
MSCTLNEGTISRSQQLPSVAMTVQVAYTWAGSHNRDSFTTGKESFDEALIEWQIMDKTQSKTGD